MTMDAVVTTLHGTLRGTETDGIRSFLGVPFAAPPSGPNRLLPPRPVEPWTGCATPPTTARHLPRLLRR